MQRQGLAKGTPVQRPVESEPQAERSGWAAGMTWALYVDCAVKPHVLIGGGDATHKNNILSG